MWKFSKGLAKAFKNSSSLARYGEGVGVVPTHAGGGTHVDGHLVGQDELMLHERAHHIATANAGKMSYADALKVAQKQLDDEAAAKNKANKFTDLRFNESRNLRVDPRSVRVARRANEIMRENSLSNARFGEALRQSLAEYAACDRVMEYAEELLRMAGRA
jgi:hypothetical protein